MSIYGWFASRDAGCVVTMRAALVFAACLVGCGGTIGGGGDASVDVFTIDAGRVPKLHRASGSACPQQRGPGDTNPFDAGPIGQCQTDVDCTAGTNGRCLVSGGGPLNYSCSYDDCFSDSDCTGNAPCECRSSSSDSAPNSCVGASTCRVDSDCGPGGYCSPSGVTTADNCGLAYHCHTASDACIDDSDCAATQGYICIFDTSHWTCEHPCFPPP